MVNSKVRFTARNSPAKPDQSENVSQSVFGFSYTKRTQGDLFWSLERYIWNKKFLYAHKSVARTILPFPLPKVIKLLKISKRETAVKTQIGSKFELL